MTTLTIRVTFDSQGAVYRLWRETGEGRPFRAPGGPEMTVRRIDPEASPADSLADFVIEINLDLPVRPDTLAGYLHKRLEEVNVVFLEDQRVLFKGAVGQGPGRVTRKRIRDAVIALNGAPKPP